MIFDTIFNFYSSLFMSVTNDSRTWTETLVVTMGGELVPAFDWFATVATVVTIICGIFALFRLLGGVLKLFKV